MNLRELQQKIAAREGLEAELSELQKKETELRERLRRETLNLGYEESDVEELEGNGLKSVFYTLIGKREERLQKELDEAEAARQQLASTKGELDGVRAQIQRVEIELRGIKQAEADYKKTILELSARIEAVKPLMSADDVGTLEIIRRELDELSARQDYYARVTEAGKELSRCLASVWDALREYVYAVRHESIFARQEHRNEMESRRGLAMLAAERFSKVLAEDTELVGDRCIDLSDLDNTIRRAEIHTYNNAPAADLFAPDVPSLDWNTAAILADIEKRTARLELHRADMEQRLSDLLRKYQTT